MNQKTTVEATKDLSTMFQNKAQMGLDTSMINMDQTDVCFIGKAHTVEEAYYTIYDTNTQQYLTATVPVSIYGVVSWTSSSSGLGSHWRFQNGITSCPSDYPSGMLGCVQIVNRLTGYTLKTPYYIFPTSP